MEHFQHSLTIAESRDATYAALTNIDSLRSWWTQDCDGTAGLNGTIRFRFGTVFKEMQVKRAEPSREVCWICTQACIDFPSLSRKDEWVGTEMVFRLSDAGPGMSQLDFTHIGLVPAFECYDMCINGWRYFLGSLQQFLETGTGTPHVAPIQCQERNMAV